MSPVIPPSIGRRVLVFCPYQTSPSDPANGPTINNLSVPFDGGVAYVHSESMLNVSYSDHNGRVFNQTSVTLLDRALEPDDAHGKGSWYAVWMPYQFEQALRAREPKTAPSGRPADVVLKKTHDNDVPVGEDSQPNVYDRAVALLDEAEASARET